MRRKVCRDGERHCRVRPAGILKQHVLIGSHRTTYMVVWLRRPDLNKKMYVHKLVAVAFVPNERSETHTIANHKDLNKMNNHAYNLEWVDSSGNMKHWRQAREEVAAEPSGPF